MSPLDQIFQAFDTGNDQEFVRLLTRLGADKLGHLYQDEKHVREARRDAALRGLDFVVLPLLARSAPDQILVVLQKTALIFDQQKTNDYDNHLVFRELGRAVLTAKPELAFGFFQWAFEQNQDFGLIELLASAPGNWSDPKFLTQILSIYKNPKHRPQIYGRLMSNAVLHKNMDLVEAISKNKYFTPKLALESLILTLSDQMSAADIHFVQTMCERGGVNMDLILDAYDPSKRTPGARHPASGCLWMDDLFRDVSLVDQNDLEGSIVLSRFLRLFTRLCQALSPTQKIFSPRHDDFFALLTSNPLVKQKNPEISSLVDRVMLSRAVASHVPPAPDKKPKVF